MLRPLPLRISLLLIAVLSVIAIGLWQARHRPATLRMVMPAIDGDGALVITPDNRTLLIDGGADGAALATWLGATLPFGTRRIDAAILTRSDSRTLPGQLAAFKRYRIGTALAAPTEQYSSGLAAWSQLLQDQYTPTRTVTAGDALNVGTCRVDVLTEGSGRLTIQLTCGATTAFFLQSVDDASLNELADRSLPRATVAVFPWSRATNVPLLDQIQPAAIVFSDDGRSSDGLTWADRQIGSARLFHETINGQIELRDTGTTIEIDTEREQATYDD